MKATLTYEGKTVEVEIKEDEARKIFGEPKTGWERVEPGQYYCYVSGGGFVAEEEEERDESDDLYYDNVNYFADRDLANDQARAISLWLRIKRWAAEHCEPVVWGPGKDGFWHYKYGISWATSVAGVNAAGSYEIVPGLQDSTRQFGNVYFDTEEHAKQCIEEFRDELLWYFTECRDRMDG